MRRRVSLVIAVLTTSLAAAGCWDLNGVKLAGADGGDTDTDSDTDIDTDTDADGGGEVEILGLSADSACTGVSDTIVFTAETTGEITSYSWEFGDGVGDDVAAPSHLYSDLGTYDVSLTVEGPEGTDSLSVPGMIRIIEPGWTRLNPQHFYGDIVEIWVDQAAPTNVWAAAENALLSWSSGESRWNQIAVDGLARLTGVAASSDWPLAAMIVGKDSSDISQVYYYNGTAAADADTGDLLPHDAQEYIGLFMPSSTTALLATMAGSSPEARIFEYTGVVAEQWVSVSATNAFPSAASAFAVGGTTGAWRLFLLNGTTLYSSTLYVNHDSIVTWHSSTLTAPCDVLAAVSAQEVWCGGPNGALFRGVVGADPTPTVAFEDLTTYSSLWTANFHFVDIGVNENADEHLLYATAIDTTTAPPETIIVRASDLDSAPTIALADTSYLLTDAYNAQIAVSGENDVWFGSANSYLSHWDGGVWNNPNGVLTTGTPGIPTAGADNHLYVPTYAGNPQRVLDFDGAEWFSSDLPPASNPKVVWPASADDIWVFGSDGMAARYSMFEWSTQDLGVGTSATFWSAWGSSTDDLWAVGESGSKAPMVMRYNGTGWAHDLSAEEVLGGVVYEIAGTAEDDVYALSEHGILAHFDGTTWAQMEQSLFSAPAEFGVCTSTVSSDCTGSGWAFGGSVLAPVEGGLFAAIVDGLYKTLSTDESNCPIDGDSRCVLTPSTESFLARRPVYYDGTTWTSMEFPDGLFTIVEPDVFMTGLWGAGAGEAYTTAFAEDPDTSEVEMLVLGWDGTVWSPLAEQPADPREFPFIMTGSRPGELFGTGQDPDAIVRYQTCIE
jgi:PKD repeat protein